MYRQKIRAIDVRKGMKIAEPVFATNDLGTTIMVVPADVLVTDKITALLERHKVKYAVVHSKVPSIGYKSSGEREDQGQPKVKPVINEVLRNEAITNIRELFTVISKPEEKNMTTAFQLIKGLDKVIDQLVASVSMDNTGVVHIYDLKKFDEYTYHHSLSVAVLSIATGLEMGMDLRQLVRLSRSAVLHDIGKMSIPVEILNKRSALTPNEFEIMKDHAKYSFMNLKTQAYGNTELWTSVMFHHEKVDGTGYPKGLQKDEIPLFSRIIAVGDMYDAVTSYRPYRDPMTPSEAYELIMSEVGKSFQYEIVEAFLKRLILYPINASLLLSDYRICYVVENENPLRPVVQIGSTGELLDLASPKNLGITIAKVFNPNEEIPLE